MNQQDAFKILAAFMILTMVFSVFAVFFQGPTATTEETPEEIQQEKYNPEFWIINQPFYSISDALNITPYGVATASYIDLESMTPQLMQWARVDSPVINEVDSLYKSNTTKVYFARLQNNSFLLLSTMFPERNDFEYIVLPDTYPPILRRQDTGGINIMGNPVIYAPDKTAVEVLEILDSPNKTANAHGQYEELLNKVDPAPYQLINSNVSFAKQFYMGIRETNGNYERTTAYTNINSSTLKKLNQLKANSTQKGFKEYNVTKSGDYTIVKIVSPELLGVLNEEIS